MDLIREALATSEKRLKLIKRAIQDAQEFGWDLKPEEWWEPEDDRAVALLERAQASLAGARPLFQEVVNG